MRERAREKEATDSREREREREKRKHLINVVLFTKSVELRIDVVKHRDDGHWRDQTADIGKADNVTEEDRDVTKHPTDRSDRLNTELAL